jgi:carboxyl-terminal processing protease
MEPTMTADTRPTEPARDPGADRVRRSYTLGALAAGIATLSFVSGVFIADLGDKPEIQAYCQEQLGTVKNREALPSYALEDVDFSDFWDIWQKVKDKHVEGGATDSEMYYGAVAGMVASLDDPYSMFFDPEMAEAFNNELSGTFEGIGAEIGIKKGQLMIIAPLSGTPAERAGLRARDSILLIDGVDTSTMTVDEAVSRIRGDKGTTVTLLIGRDGVREPKEYVITRGTIVVESVKTEMKDVDGMNIAVITLSHFNDDAGSGFDRAVRSVLLESPDGIVLDMRNNPGGYLDTAVDVAGEWLEHELVVEERFGDGTEKGHQSDGSAKFADMPTVVLVNGGSASASEIVAGALQDWGAATVVGEQTYGKGSVQDYEEFEDGSALKLTVALWYTPKGRSIDKDGIKPDIEVKSSPDDFDNDLDPQMDKAIELLTAGDEGQEAGSGEQETDDGV